MPSLRHFTLTGIVAALACRGAPALAQHHGSARVVDTTFTIERRGLVNVSVTGSRLQISSWDSSAVRIRMSRGAPPMRIVARPAEMIVEPEGNATESESLIELTVPIAARLKARALHGVIRVRDLRGTVEVGSESGNILVSDVAGEVHLSSVSGTIVATRVTGAVDITSVEGDVVLEEAKGNLSIATVSGDVKLRNAAASFVRAQSTDGDLRYTGTIEPRGAYTFSTHSGDVQLSVPSTVNADITIATWSGSVESEFVMAAPLSGRPFTFRVGSGGAQVKLETFSGEISIGTIGRRR